MEVLMRTTLIVINVIVILFAVTALRIR